MNTECKAGKFTLWGGRSSKGTKLSHVHTPIGKPENHEETYMNRTITCKSLHGQHRIKPRTL